MTSSARPSLIRSLSGFAAEIRHRGAARSLAHFDERMLSDIGVARSGIDFAVRHGRRADSVPRRSRARFAAVVAGPIFVVLALTAALVEILRSG